MTATLLLSTAFQACQHLDGMLGMWARIYTMVVGVFASILFLQKSVGFAAQFFEETNG